MTDIQDEIKGYRERILGVIEGLPEAGAIAFTKVHVDGKEYSVTQRAWTVYDAIATLKFGIDLAEKAGLLTKAPEPVKIPAMEDGFPVVDQEGEPVMVELPGDAQALRIKEVYHGKDKSGKKDLFKVVVEGTPMDFGGKYGMITFGVPAAYEGWKSWPVDTKYPPKPQANVVIANPKVEGGYPEILDFRGE